MHPYAFLLGAAGLAVNFAAAQDLTPSEVFQAVSPSVVVIEVLNSEGQAISQGSGVVTEPGVVVTNCHVLKQAEVTRVRMATQKWTAHVRHTDRARDLCSLAVPGLMAPPVSKRLASTLKVGESVFALGAPQGFELSLSNGILSSLRQMDGGSVLQVTAAISPGSSGGGLFDARGRLIGITTLYWKEGQQLNFAVPADWIEELPKRSGLADAALDPESRRAFPPKYPPELVGSGVSGDVTIIVTLSAGGLVDDVAIEKSSRNRLLDEAAKAAAWKWTYYPAQRDGKPVPSRIRVPLSFEGGAAAGMASPQPDDGAIARARQQLVDFDAYMQKNDPTYASKRPKLNELVYQVRQTLPPERWLQATRDAYDSLESDADSDSQSDGRWALISTNSGGATYIDERSRQRNGQRVTAWFRHDYSPPTLDKKNRRVSKVLSQRIVDCQGRTEALISAVSYGADDQLLETASGYQLSRVVPETIGELWWKAACD